MLKHKQYHNWFAHSGCQLTPQDMMNFWLLPNNQTNIKQTTSILLCYSLPPILSSFLSLSSALLKNDSDTSEWWTPSMCWPFSFGLVTHPPALVHVDETETDEDILQCVCMCGWRWGMVGGGVLQWHSEIGFGVGGWWPTHLQISSQPGRLIQTQEACWRAVMTGPEREERDRQGDRQMGRMGSWQWYTYWDCVHISMYATFRFNIQIVRLLGYE